MQLTFEPEPEKKGELIFSLKVPGRLPSWNKLLAMEHWERNTFKKKLANDFLYALQASANTCLTRTTSVKNSYATYYATLVSYRETARQLRKFRSAKRKLNPVARRKFRSKSSNSKVPF